VVTELRGLFERRASWRNRRNPRAVLEKGRGCQERKKEVEEMKRNDYRLEQTSLMGSPWLAQSACDISLSG